MKRAVLARIESIALVSGALLITISVGAVDWRAGLFVAGLALIASTIDIAPRSRR